ncbi:MAG: hypothetical protein R3E56_11025 [Burkholderiaceae bacterium]
MSSRFAKLLRASTGAAVLIRALLAAVITALLVFALTHLNKELQVQVHTLTKNREALQIYYTDSERRFDETRNRTQRADGGAWAPHHFTIRSYREIPAVRVDPMANKGLIELGEVVLTGKWHAVRLAGPALLASMSTRHDLEVLAVSPETVRFQATSIDPFFILEVPGALFDAPLDQLIPRALGWGLVAGLAWLVAELVSGYLKAEFHSTYQRVRQALRTGWLLPVVACAGLTFHASDQITSTPIVGDGVQNLLIAYNVFRYNTFSIDSETDHPHPSNLREPLPPLVTALYLKTLSNIQTAPPFRQFRAGEQTRFLKLSNLIWVYAGLLGVWMLALRLTRNLFAGAAAALATYLFFFHAPTYIDTLYTELQTATLLVWGSYLWLVAVERRSLFWHLLAGVVIGLLVLTKASFFYIGATAIACLFVMGLLRPGENRRHWALATACLIAGFAAAMAPWVARNELQLGNARLSDRGGLILWGRATLNHMTDEEVLGLLYIKSPSLYQRWVDGTNWGPHGPGDFERGGRWQRLNRGLSSFWASDLRAAYSGRPEDAVSFHARASAEYGRQVRQLQAQGVPYPVQVVDEALKKKAIEMIKAAPGRHLFMTLPFLWHGFWGFQKIDIPVVSFSTQNMIDEVINLFAGLSLIVAFFAGVLLRRTDWVALTILPFGMMMFYATLTHNIPRYNTPLHPVMLVMLVWGLFVAWRAGFRMRRGSQAPLTQTA